MAVDDGKCLMSTFSIGRCLTCTVFALDIQGIIAEVNHAIGATGVVSQECKAVVAQYGETIIEMLLAKVPVKLLCSMIKFFIFSDVFLFLVDSLIIIITIYGRTNHKKFAHKLVCAHSMVLEV